MIPVNVTRSLQLIETVRNSLHTYTFHDIVNNAPYSPPLVHVGVNIDHTLDEIKQGVFSGRYASEIELMNHISE